MLLKRKQKLENKEKRKLKRDKSTNRVLTLIYLNKKQSAECDDYQPAIR